MFETIFVLFALAHGAPQSESYAMFAMNTQADCETVAVIFNKTAADETFYCEERN